MAVKKKTETAIDVVSIKQERVRFCVLGATPLIHHKLSVRSQKELLLPSKRKNKAERESIAKHDPIKEFRESCEYMDSGETYIGLLSTAFKGALANVAIDLPGATKAQISRLSYVEGAKVHIYSVPKLFMTPVRNSGMNRTPDIRTRAISPEWAAFVDVRYTVPMLTLKTISMLFQSAGMIGGVGDFRPQKGAGNYGTFTVVEEKDKAFQRIIKEGGRDAQIAAMKRADPYDAHSAELLDWFQNEAGERELKVAS